MAVTRFRLATEGEVRQFVAPIFIVPIFMLE